MAAAKLPPHGNKKHPWEKWEDGATHRVTKGTHFHCEVESFRKHLYYRAKCGNKTVEARVKGNRITFQFKAG